MNPKLSVIVPVYNAKKYLRQCIDSILSQDFTELELILINDGSMDGSGAICDEFAGRDSRVKVVHGINEGVSKARNKGMEMALGEYIGFVDADDWIEANMYSEMLNMINHYQADMGICGFIRDDGVVIRNRLLPVDNQMVYFGNTLKEKLLPAYISTIDLHGNRQAVMESSVWKCVFHKDLIKANQIFFNPRLKNREDVVFFIQVLSVAERVAVSQQPYYHYRQDIRTKTSVTLRYMQDAYQNLRLSQEEIEAVVRRIGYGERMKKPLQWSNCMLVLAAIRNLSAPGSPHNFRERVRLTRCFITDSGFKDNVDKLDYSFFRWDHRILIWMLRHSFIRTANFFYNIRHRVW
ncbi:MAG: glycosyltransferase [Syntrophomonadaceae bacterium]|jgi:glycosyltransferase involved in cell wall biosynthesis